LTCTPCRRDSRRRSGRIQAAPQEAHSSAEETRRQTKAGRAPSPSRSPRTCQSAQRNAAHFTQAIQAQTRPSNGTRAQLHRCQEGKNSCNRRHHEVVYICGAHNSACKLDPGRLCPGLLVFDSRRCFALSNQETFEHLGRQFVSGIVRVEEAIPKLVARLVAKLAGSGTAAALRLAQRSQRPRSNLRLSSSLLLLAALALVPCFLEFLRLRRP
jgi:hypothetical protein